MIKYMAVFLLLSPATFAQKATYKEQYRPQFHFSPPAHWMNDPNGMVYYKGIYHLFYQYYPKATVWGPMHWGHATSSDLIHWKNQPIALYPDGLGWIFSGSAVVDYHNTSGFGKNGRPPLVAIFTHHNQAKEKDGKNDTENESIAYSNDDGIRWSKYKGNPVLANSGISDFRDPNVFWYEAAHKWVMALATKDRITFYSSPDLKHWWKESEFGAHLGSHGGVWECPDLFPITASDGKKLWILLVSVGSGGPNGGSATQYFVGNFDGKTFTAIQKDIRWMDSGTDQYAGVTWHNTGKRRVFLGWMSNWQYAATVPTKTWRSAMTVPRELKLFKYKSTYYVNEEPVRELEKLDFNPSVLNNLAVKGAINLSKLFRLSSAQFELSLSTNNLKGFAITLSNSLQEQLIVGYNDAEKSWYIDRTNAGISGFNRDFAKRISARHIADSDYTNIRLVVDAASIELFADNGLTVMTAVFFPSKPYEKIIISSPKNFVSTDIAYASLQSIWQ